MALLENPLIVSMFTTLLLAFGGYLIMLLRALAAKLETNTQITAAVTRTVGEVERSVLAVKDEVKEIAGTTMKTEVLVQSQATELQVCKELLGCLPPAPPPPPPQVRLC